MLLQRAERTLRRLEITPQKEEHRPAGGDSALHITLKDAARAGGVAVKIDRGMPVFVRRGDARQKVLFRIAPRRIQDREAKIALRAVSGRH